VNVTCEEVTVSISAPSEVVVGTSFTADVSVTEVSNLDTAYFVLYFDPAVLQATGVRSGDLTAPATPIFNIDNANGLVTVVVNIPSLTGVSGEGTIAEIDFDAIGCVPNFSDLTLSDVLLGDIDARRFLL
jgi:Flp pilus assembly secretin CpaC